MPLTDSWGALKEGANLSQAPMSRSKFPTSRPVSIQPPSNLHPVFSPPSLLVALVSLKDPSPLPTPQWPMPKSGSRFLTFTTPLTHPTSDYKQQAVAPSRGSNSGSKALFSGSFLPRGASAYQKARNFNTIRKTPAVPLCSKTTIRAHQ